MNPNLNPAADPQSSAGSSASTASSTPLQRGKACLPCRRRKMKCDSARPICTPCLRGDRAEDCEYTDGQRRPRTLTLEEDVARLRARVQELENPQQATPSVELFAPYAPSGAGPSGATTASAHVGQARGQGPYHQVAETRSHGLPSPGAADPRRTDTEANVQLHARRALSVVGPHAAELGFFLNIERLRVQGTHILPALQSALTLWSIHITSASEADHAQAHERTETLASTILSRAQTEFTAALSTVDAEPDSAIFLHVIQTAVLLAYYMQRTGQLVGARYYASGTWALATTLKLYRRPHLSTREEGQTSRGSGVREGPVQEHASTDPSARALEFTGFARLAPALDGIEAEERVRAFWAVYALDRWFSVAFDAACPSLMMDDNEGRLMTVPWPGVGGVVGTRSNAVQGFLNDPNHDFAQEGASAMHAKASVLLGEAAGIAASFVADHAISQSTAFRTRFGTLDTLLQRCLNAAITLAAASHGHQSQTQERTQALVSVHLIALAHVTLHRPFISTYGPSRRRSVEGSLGVIRVLNQLGEVGVDAGGISPIYVIVWTALCLSMNEEVHRLRARSDGDPSRHREEGELTAAIRKLVSALSSLSQHLPSRFYAAPIEALLPVVGSITV